MRRAQIIFCLISIIAASLAQKDDEFFSKKTFIKSRNGFMRLGSNDWIVKSDGDTIIIATRVSSKMNTGSILSLFGSKGDEKVFELRLGMNKSLLSVDLLDSSNLSILSLPFDDHNLNSASIDEHSIGVRIKPSTGELIYSFENDKEMIARITKSLHLQDTKLEVVLGSEDGSSLVGCLTLVSVTSLFSPITDIFTIAEADTQSCALAGNECAERDCGDGVCKELETATCDCFGTGKAGPNCRSAVPSAHFSSLSDGTLRYTPIPGEDQHIHRLALNFRLDDKGDQQGVLLSARLINEKRMTVYVVNGKGKLQIDTDSSLDFDLDATIHDHSLALYISDQSISLQTDDKEQLKLDVDCGGPDCLRFSEIHLGAEPPTSQVRRIGMNGCIWETYADHYNVLSMYYDGHPRVSSNQKLQRCNGDEEEVVYDPQEFPSSLMSHSLPQVNPDPTLFSADSSSINTGSILPPPLKKLADLPSTPCNNALGDKCRNGATCIVRSQDKVCLCPHGFTGVNCEFSQIPRTCAEAFDFYRLPNGPTLIDVDGSGPLPKSVVDCQNGTTTIINDMPERTVVHDTIEQHTQFILSYRDFTPQQVAMMVVESEKCTQAVHYECTRAALGFEKSKTQFSLAGSNRTVMRIGKTEKKCGDARCTCEYDALGEDDGLLSSPDVGITKILAFRDHSIASQNGQISVGPLVCKSHPQSQTPLRFSAPAGVFLDRVFDRDLSIQFRTAASSGLILSTAGGLKLRIKSQYTLSLTIGDDFEMTVQSPNRLNNTAWHLIIIEIVGDFIRFSVDNVVVVEKIPMEMPTLGQIQLGDPFEGFTGCLRTLRLNNEVLDLHQETQHVETNEVHLTCPEKCSSALCENDAECHENLLDPSAEPVCVCKFPQIQHGTKCEIDINKLPPVSFHGGHLKYEEMEGSLDGELVLSFRTDQQQGLILFAHDHLNNFIQLHLSSETTISLTLNNRAEVRSVTIEAEPGKEYSNMEWVQVVISHHDNSTLLSVNGKTAFIPEMRQLSTEQIKTYAHVETEIVKIPVGVQSTTTVNPYLLTYLGGVKEVTKSNGQVTLFARYDTSIPDFLGCVRGFRVGGHTIDLTHTTKGTRPADPDLVQVGCDLGCSTLSCGNGGHCGMEWKNFNPAAQRATCNCERTSYRGDKCMQDDAITLSNGISAKVDIAGYLSRLTAPDQSHFQTLKLAFKSNNLPATKQTIATITFADDRFFEVVLNRNGSVQVGLVKGEVTANRAKVLTFAGNFTDGFRHLLVAQFKNDSATAILIDSIRHDLPYEFPNLDLFKAKTLIIGGSEDIHVQAEREHFDGCVSNVELDYQLSGVKIDPIAELIDASTARYPVTTLYPEGTTISAVQLESCGQFKEKDHLPGLNSKVDFPVWDTNFGRLIYSGLWLEGGEEDSGFPWWIIVLVLLIIAVIIGIFVYLICFRNKKPQKKTPEEVPLNPPRPLVISSPIASPTAKKPTNNYTIPPPDVDIPPPATHEKKDADKVSLRSHSTTLKSEAYFTAPEFQSDGDEEEDDRSWDKTLTEATIQRPDELNDLPPHFTRTMPHRMSSFKRSDHTVPVGSPLYVADSRRQINSPKPVPPPRLNN